MKINQVEELVGITKKNIRFYEAQGLLNPDRNPDNGYREYSLQDVRQLQRIKLLRKLDVPCEQIRLMTQGTLSLDQCLRNQEETLEKRGRDLERMQELCSQLAENERSLDTLNAAGWLDQMKILEKGGVQFMDASRSDVRQRKWGAILSAVASILFMAAVIWLLLWANHQDPLPTALIVFMVTIPAVVIIGIGLALIQRIRELKGGELDEAGKY